MMSESKHAAMALGVALAIAGCSDPPASAPPDATESAPALFTDVTATSGIDMMLTSGGTPSTQIVEVKGGGVALLDMDGDGDLDLFVPNGATLDSPTRGPGARVYKNVGAATDDIRFEDVTAESNVTFRGWGVGVATGDYDADGRVDVYITCFGPNVLLRNVSTDERIAFEDVTQQAGVGDDGFSAASAFGDVDGDGDLDLYVANYVEFDVANPPPASRFKGQPVLAGPLGLEAGVDVLYENRGDGTFEDVSGVSGIQSVVPSFGLGVVILDFNDDGRQEILVGNDSQRNFYFVRGEDDVFIDRAVHTGAASNGDGSNQATMGIAIGDVDDNGLADVFTTNFSSDSNTLHLNKASGFFDDGTQRFGLGIVSRPYLGWACGLYDFDLDGDEDALVFNGHVYPNATLEHMDSTYRQPPLYFERRGRRFERVESDAAWQAAEHVDRGAAFGDLDLDGDVDVVVAELNGPIRVLRNETTDQPWLVVDPGALGAMVEVTAGDHVHRRWVYGGGSFASASAHTAYFGFADPVHRVDVTIRYGDGRVVKRDDVPIGSYLRISAVP